MRVSCDLIRESLVEKLAELGDGVVSRHELIRSQLIYPTVRCSVLRNDRGYIL